MRNLGKLLIALAVVLSIGTVLYWLYTIPGEEKSENPEAALFASSPLRPSDIVTIEATAKRNRVNRDTGTDIQIYATNLSHDVVNISFLDIQAPGFTTSPTSIVSPGLLKPSESKEIDVHLIPSVDHGRFVFAVRYAWSAPNTLEKKSRISLGPFEIVDESRIRKLRFLRRTASLTKDLTLPLVLALLGYLFQRQQNKRDEKFKQDQVDRDRHYQVWSSILPRFHQLSEKHYLPIVRSLRLVLERKPTIAALGDPDTMSQYLYELLLLLRRMAYLREDKGQIFFYSRTAESTVSLAWKVFVERVETRFGTVNRDQALQIIRPTDSYFSFQKRFADPTDPTKTRAGQLHVKLRQELIDWINEGQANLKGEDFGKHLGLIRIMKEAVYFEANRPFDEYWYGSKPKFSLEANISLPDGPNDIIRDLKTFLKQYVDETEKYLSEN